MTGEQYVQFLQDRRMRGVFCVIDPSPQAVCGPLRHEPTALPLQGDPRIIKEAPKVAPPPAAGSAPQFPPAPDILHATVTSLQNARSRQYCVDLLTMKAYYLGKEITGRYFDEVPTTDPTSTPPVGMRGLLMTRAQWNDYCARKGFSGNTCVIDSE